MNITFIKFYFIVVLILHITIALPRIKRALGSYDIYLWSNATVPYIIDESFSDSEQLDIQMAMDSIQSVSCVTFVKYRRTVHANWLKLENGKNCFSQIGMQNSGEQSVILSKTCRQYGLIIHELGHTIGLLHEMMRPDRNQYIRYFPENTQENAHISFVIESNHYKLFNTPFDFQSVMMYSPYEFSNNGLPTWIKINNSDITPMFDVREKDLSFWDAKAINNIYKCAKNCSNVHCSENNYLDKNCVCQTPEGFAKQRCVDSIHHKELCRNANETNICYDKPVISSVLCRKTCGRCFRYGSEGNSSPPPYKCVDQDEIKCKQYKNDGYCYIDTWTKVYCKKSCNRCSNHNDLSIVEFACKDRYNSDLCEEWAKNGQCDINPGFMKSSCAMSCGVCSKNSTIKRPNEPCRNYSPDSYCDAMARQNKCESTTLKVCLGSCGKCGENYERNEPNKTEKEIAKNHENKNTNECKDKIANCDYFARAGMCINHKESMTFHCSKTCNFCFQDSCQNEDSNDVCDAVKHRGFCTSHAGFAERCKKTCKLCQIVEGTFSEPCKDLDSRYICKEIVRRNQCNSDRYKRCKLSCGVCNATTVTSITTKETRAIAPCVNDDSEESCEDLKIRGLCQSHLNRAVLCRKTCDLCILYTTTAVMTTTCTNIGDDETCNSWASSGYCNENKDYMKENCAKACHFCQINNARTEVESNCKNTESSEQCKSWVELGYCKEYSDYMRINCLNSCGRCSPVQNTVSTVPSSTTTVNELCKNDASDESCESWKNSYCSVSHIAEMCKKSCGICLKV